jgi:hypothetical protein
MNYLSVFILRAIIGSVIAIVIMRTFHPGSGPFTVAVLGVLLVGTPYLLDYLRERHHDK